MKNKIIIIISWAMVAISMGIIFIFSSENSTKSSQTSESVTENILNTVLPEEQVTPSLVKKANLPIRKIAHFCVFSMLGFFIINALSFTFKKNRILLSVISLGSSFLYAISDEFHQKFVSGRVMSWKDVLIDTLGALCGIFAYLLLAFIIYKIINRKKKNSVA